MKRRIVGLSALLTAFCVLFSACGNSTTETKAEPDKKIEQASAESEANVRPAGYYSAISAEFGDEDYFSGYESKPRTKIDLSKGNAEIVSSGIYEVSGTLSDGSLLVDVNKDVDKETVFIVLNGADITSADSAPIYIAEAKKVVIVLADGSENTISQGASTVADESGEPSAALFSKADLTITGAGTLNVKSEFNDGICSKDDLLITSGNIVIGAVGDGIVGKDLLAIADANITVTAGKDGLRSTNSEDAGRGNLLILGGRYGIICAGDAIQAERILQIDGGSFTVSSGGGFTGVAERSDMFGRGMEYASGTGAAETDDASAKGLKGLELLVINGGTFSLSCADDAVHGNADVMVTGGTISMETGDDALHADGALTITGADISIANCYEGLEGTNISVEAGTVTLKSSDDGINMNGSDGQLNISGGLINMDVGADGVDSNCTILMSGGEVYISGPINDANGAIDFERGFSMNGGTIVAAGSSGMAEAPDDTSAQCSILMYFTSSRAANTAVSLVDSDGNILAEFVPEKQYSSVVISAPGIETGGEYTLCSGGAAVVTFTVSDSVTYLNESGVTQAGSGVGMGGPHDGMGGKTPDRVPPDGFTARQKPDGTRRDTGSDVQTPDDAG